MNHILISLAALLAAVLPVLIDSTLKGGALLVLAGVTTLGLRKASAAARHFIWFSALAALLVLPVLSALLPGWRVLPRWTAMAGQAVPSAMSEAPRLMLPSVEQPVAPGGGVASAARSSSARHVVPEEAITIRSWLPLVWAAGTALLVIRLLASSWLLFRAARGCAIAADERLCEMMEATKRQLEIRQPVRMLVDSRKTIPMVWGVFRPRLLLPAEAMRWGDSQLRSVLLHELAHVRRCDIAVKWLMQVTCAIHWFNPLVWLAAWRLHVEGESACDNLVLASGVRASEYAEHLLHVATRFSAPCWKHACGLAMARPSRLEGRLLAVLNERLNRRGVTRSLALGSLVLGLCVIIPVAMLRAADDKSDGATSNSTVAAQQPNAAPSSLPEGVTVVIADNGSLTFGGKAVTLDDLMDELAVLRRTHPDVHVIIRTPPDAEHATVVKVVDALKRARVASISLLTQGGDPGDASRIRLRQAEKELERASVLHRQKLISQAEYDKAQSDVEVRRAELSGNKAEVVRAKLQFADSQLTRLTKLHAKGLVSEKELDQAAYTVELLKAELEVVSAQTTQAEEHRRKAEAGNGEVDIAQADLNIAKAKLNRVADLVNRKLAAQPELEVAKAEVIKAEAQLRLAMAQYEQIGLGNAAEKMPPTQLKTERLLQILAEEIKVAEDQARLARAQYQAGTATLETSLRAELDVLALKREVARLEGNVGKARDLTGQEIRALEDLEPRLREQRKAGVASEADELKLRREILALKRQQAELE